MKKLGKIGRPGHRVNGDRGPKPRNRVGVRPRLCRRRDPSRLRRGARRREGGDSGRLPAPGGRALRRLRDPGRAGDDRQRLLLPGGRPRARLPRARDPAPPHRPYRPRTNGKAERFIRTMLGGWAYGAIYQTSAQRRRALPGWLDFYNRHRPHGSLSRQAPIERLHSLRTTCLGRSRCRTQAGWFCWPGVGGRGLSVVCDGCSARASRQGRRCVRCLSVDRSVGPAMEHGADEAFGFAVCLGPVRPGAAVFDAEAAAGE